MTAHDDFGDRFTALMSTLGLSQNDIAAQLEVSQGFVSDVARGNKKPGAEFLLKLRGAYGVNVNWLLDGRGAMFGDPIYPELFKLVVAVVELASQALIDSDADAQNLVSKLQAVAPRTDSTIEPALLETLASYEEADRHASLAARIYNQVLATAPPDGRMACMLDLAIAQFRQVRPLKGTEALKQGARGEVPTKARAKRGVIQVITGDAARVAGRDYIETQKNRGKK